uniref:Uncharacterized protein n=1 Tax=Romanomermis culicivorax TaxID=13658 RepID=A0A915K0N0_ROMCU
MKIVQLENKQYKEDEEVRLRNLKNLEDFPSTSTYDLERQVGYEIFPKSRWMLGVHRDRALQEKTRVEIMF